MRTLWCAELIQTAPNLLDFLTAIGIKVEDDLTVGDDELSDATIYRLAQANGYYIGADVTLATWAE